LAIIGVLVLFSIKFLFILWIPKGGTYYLSKILFFSAQFKAANELDPTETYFLEEQEVFITLLLDPNILGTSDKIGE
jgi:hypothetical protein